MVELNDFMKRRYEIPWGYKRAILGKDKEDRNEVVEIIMEKGDETKLHYHKETTEMFYIVCGSASIYVDNDLYKVSEGDFLKIKPYEKHKIVAGNNGVKIIAIKTPANEEDRIFLE